MKEENCELLEAMPFVTFFHHPDFVLAASDAPHVIVGKPNGHIHTINVTRSKRVRRKFLRSSKTIRLPAALQRILADQIWRLSASSLTI